jgi:predicted N-acyltransferase
VAAHFPTRRCKPDLNLRIVESVAAIPATQWDALAAATGAANPFLRHAFLLALEESGCATPETGWQAQFLTLWEGDRLVGAMPLYAKTHSWGEFVFDWAWADAYQRHGLRYYPKLVSSIPFSPIAGARLLGESPEIRAELIRTALDLARETGASSLHCLFPTEDQAGELRAQGLLLRQGVQFHWRNPGYADFADYLAGLRRDKRKKIQQERRKVADAGITFRHLHGGEIGEEDWRHFMACYARTHEQFNSPQALNLDFFRRLGANLPENQLLVIAYRDGKPIASAWNLHDEKTVYGRAWGTLEYHPGLHFETCYYQAIEFCIARRIPLFEGGAQGEHKLARGFLPVTTWSAHWLAHPRFFHAVEDFLAREAQGMARYVNELNESNPFKRPSAPRS